MSKRSGKVIVIYDDVNYNNPEIKGFEVFDEVVMRMPEEGILDCYKRCAHILYSKYGVDLNNLYVSGNILRRKQLDTFRYMNAVGEFLLTRSVENLSNYSKEFLFTDYPDIQYSYFNNIARAQEEFEVFQDTFMDKFFDGSAKENEELKRICFDQLVDLPGVSVKKLKKFKNSEKYDKNSIVREIRDILGKSNSYNR